MTDRKFTPPTEFPAEYVTSDGRKAVILGRMPCGSYPYVGYVRDEDGSCTVSDWGKDGRAPLSLSLHDLPKRETSDGLALPTDEAHRRAWDCVVCRA